MIVDDPNLVPDKFIVACHIIYDGKILYVKRNPNKPQGNKWGSVAGKKEEGESNLDAIKRELKEEVGLEFKDKDFKYLKTWNVVFNSPKKGVKYNSFSYCLYKIELDYLPKIILRDEELVNYAWFTPQEALRQSLVEDEDGVLKDIYNL